MVVMVVVKIIFCEFRIEDIEIELERESLMILMMGSDMNMIF